MRRRKQQRRLISHDARYKYVNHSVLIFIKSESQKKVCDKARIYDVGKSVRSKCILSNFLTQNHFFA